MDLREFDFIVSHRLGKENLNADALSRLVTDACTIEQVNSAEEQKKDSIPTAPTCFISLIPHFNLQDAQLHDPDIQLVAASMREQSYRAENRGWTKYFCPNAHVRSKTCLRHMTFYNIC